MSLRTAGNLVCFRFEQTATAVSLSAPPSSAWEKPAGIDFKPMLGAQDADSAARGMVGYLASQQLSDSIAAGKAAMEKAKSEAAAKGRPMTDEEKAQMKREFGNAAVDAAKQGATSKLRGLIKKPRIP